MKKLLTIASLAVAMGTGSVASASTYEFVDMIDYWTLNGTDYYESVYIDQDLDVSNVIYQGVTDIFNPGGTINVAAPFSYQHDINDDVDFLAGHYVTSATLELDFTNFDLLECGDSHGSFLWFHWDGREEVSYTYDDGSSSWVEIGQDNDVQSVVLDIDWLNDDGLLDVTINLQNSLGTADIGLDHSKLYGTAQTPVPEPATMLLFGAGLAGLVGVKRRKRN